MKTVLTFGTFDIFHVGHVNILKRASMYGDRLVVGVSSDKLNNDKKGRNPIYPQIDRLKIVQSLSFVNDAFIEESLEKKRDYLNYYNADFLVMGDDWEGRFDCFSDVCEVVYLPRTPSVSTTELIEVVKSI